MKCKEVMTPNPRCCTIFSEVIEAAQIMHEDKVGLVPVLDDETTQIVVGMITEKDLFLELVGTGDDDIEELKVGECMNRSPIVCFPEDDIQDAIRLMKSHRIQFIPVVNQIGCCLGLIAQTEIEGKTEHPATSEPLYNLFSDASASKA